MNKKFVYQVGNNKKVMLITLTTHWTFDIQMTVHRNIFL